MDPASKDLYLRTFASCTQAWALFRLRCLPSGASSRCLRVSAAENPISLTPPFACTPSQTRQVKLELDSSCVLQAVDIAIVKATTAKFSVVPKEKHVRSAFLRSASTGHSRGCHLSVHVHTDNTPSVKVTHAACHHAIFVHRTHGQACIWHSGLRRLLIWAPPFLRAALKMATHGGQPGSYAGYVIQKLLERMHAAKHWLVRL